MMKRYLPIAIAFVIISAIVLASAGQLQNWNVNTNFLLGANTILFVLSSVGFFLQMKGATSVNTNAFLRGVYSSLLMKLFLIVGAVLIYVAVIGGEINKRALLASLLLYLIYTFIEVVQLMKILRTKNNG